MVLLEGLDCFLVFFVRLVEAGRIGLELVFLALDTLADLPLAFVALAFFDFAFLVTFLATSIHFPKSKNHCNCPYKNNLSLPAGRP